MDSPLEIFLVALVCSFFRFRAPNTTSARRIALLALGLGVTFFAQASESIATWKPLVPAKPGSVSWYCAKSSDLAWQVALNTGAVEVTGLTLDELYSVDFNSAAETPQFSFGKLRDFPRRFVEVADGFLVGYNKGEWGGKLYWFSRDGKARYRISDHQVTGFFRHGTDLFAFEGMSHMGLDYGSMIKVEKLRGKWTARTIAKLAGAPGPYFADGTERVLLLVGPRLFSLDFAGSQHVLHRSGSPSGLESASSVVRAPDGAIFIGTGRGVIRLTPQGTSFREQWLLPPQDAEACECRAAGLPPDSEKETLEPVRCD
jgi:hypothetical protein